MITIEFYWNDLTKKKQDEILKTLKITNDEHGWDFFPIATLDIEEDAFRED